MIFTVLNRRLMSGILFAAALLSSPMWAASAYAETFVYAVPAVGQTVDPALFEGDPGRWTKWDLASNLVTYDFSKIQGNGCTELASIGQLKLNLAESFELSPDKTYYTIKLKEAKSPAGNALSADDVLWSFERHKALSPIARTMYFTQARYRPEKTIEIVDPRTVKLYVTQPTSMDLAIHTITGTTMGIYDSIEAKKHATADDPWAKNWLATHTANYGPWMVQSFEPGNQVVYIPNPNYAEKRGNIDRVVIRAIPDSSTRMQLLQAGEIDFAARLTFDEYASLKGSPGVVVEQCVSANRDMLQLQLADPHFADVRVRRAISLAIDRKALVDSVYRGFATPATTGLPKSFGAPSSGETLRYDPVEAKRLLAEAGYPNGFEATMLISPSSPGPHAEQLAVILRSQLQKVGLNWKIEVAPSATDFNTRFREKRYQALINLDPPGIADPLYTLRNYNYSSSSQNTHGYSNPEYDALLNQLDKVLKPGPERDALLKKIDKVVMDTIPLIYLSERQYIHAYRDNIKGFINIPAGEVEAVRLTKTQSK